MANNLYIIFFIFILFSSCLSKDEREIIASVNEKNLYFSDIIDFLPNQVSDSVYFVEKFINEWIRRELMISYAEMNLNKDLLQFEKEIKDYRESLLIYTYQQELVNQNLDTLISLPEVEDYYEEYRDQFKLNKNIFKGRFIVVDKSAPRLKELTKWYKSEKAHHIESLEDYCLQFAKEYYFTDSSWQYFTKINNRLPNLIEEEEYFLRNTKSVWYEDQICRYYIYIKEYKIKGDQSPLDFETKKIKNILTNKKKINYLKQLENELYQNALVKQKIKIY